MTDPSKPGARMRLVFFGSGAFGIPTLHALMERHEVALVITQPDRPAGRNQQSAPTPIAAFTELHNVPTVKPENVNDASVVQRVRDIGPDVNVVIAYGQKIGVNMRSIAPTINLHGSLLPKYRGAAPIQWAVLNGDAETGVSVIDVAERMDAGAIHAVAKTAIDPMETAGELHDRLAQLGPALMLSVLDGFRLGTANSIEQDESAATRAPKLNKELGTVRFDQSAEHVRARVHGLTPWPGCTVLLNRQPLKLLRSQVVEVAGNLAAVNNLPPGTLTTNGMVLCDPGVVRLLTVQPSGGKVMSFESYCHGRQIQQGARFEPFQRQPASRPREMGEV